MSVPFKSPSTRPSGSALKILAAAVAGGVLMWGLDRGGIFWLPGVSAGAGLVWLLARSFKTGTAVEDSFGGVSMRQIAESSFGIEALLDARGKLCWISPSVERITGYSASECLAAVDPIELLVHDSDREFGKAERIKALTGANGCLEIRLGHRERGVVWVACNWHAIRDDEGSLLAVRLSADDIQSRRETELKQLEALADARRARALSEHYLVRSKDERQRLAALLNTIRLGIVLFDTDRRVQYFNQSFLSMWGFPDAENLFGIRDTALFDRCEALLADVPAYRQHVSELLAGPVEDTHFEFVLKDGRVITESSALIMREGRDEEIGRVWIMEDVTEVRTSANLLMSLAERDSLTGLYNRRRFDEDIARALDEAARRKRQVGLLVFDLDGFKPINDTYGHQAGDHVLVRLSERVGRVVRRHEMFFRFGGDEFAILVPDSEPPSLEELARRVVAVVAETRFELGGQSIAVTVSVGLACYPQDADHVAGLMAAADEAMYRAKGAGRNRWLGQERAE